jgi:23S rRNA pseudouridine2605 synthase
MHLVRIKKRVFPVGRLDYDSEGLLLLTNDGDLAYKLMHPKFLVHKTYLVKLNKPLDDKNLHHLAQGVNIEDRKTARASVSIVPDSGRKLVRISIHEGRNRQVKKMFESVGLYVRKLRRIEYANLKDNSLKPGRWRYLTRQEIERLKKIDG